MEYRIIVDGAWPATAPGESMRQNARPVSQADGAGQPAATEDLQSRMQDIASRLNDFVNDFVRDNRRELEFQVGGERDQVVILVKHSETGEVLRAIPPEQAFRLDSNLDVTAAALVDQFA